MSCYLFRLNCARRFKGANLKPIVFDETGMIVEGADLDKLSRTLSRTSTASKRSSGKKASSAPPVESLQPRSANSLDSSASDSISVTSNPIQAAMRTSNMDARFRPSAMSIISASEDDSSIVM
jgi:hypothetical protein